MKNKIKAFSATLAKLSAMICLIAMLTALTVAANSDFPFVGDGTSSEPFRIYSEKDLFALASKISDNFYSSAYYELENDITITSEAWTPIGSSSASFKGTFLGKGHTISGLKSNEDISYLGFFGSISGAVIKDLTLEVDFNGVNYVGGLAGYSYGSTITNCLTKGTVTGTGTNIGGFIGKNYDGGVISYSGSTANVTGKENVGGFIGYNQTSGRISTISNCYAQGDVMGSGNYTGGFVGESYGDQSYNRQMYYPFVKNCYASGIVNNGRGRGLELASRGVSNSYYLSSNTDSSGGFPVSDAELKDKSTFYCWDFENIWEMDGGYPYINLRGEIPTSIYAGSGTSSDPYLVTNELQLHSIAMENITTNVYYKLTNDIEITAKFWTPIGVHYYYEFGGVFDGNGYTITLSGLDYTYLLYDFVGLFGLNEGTIKNLTVIGDVKGRIATGISRAGILTSTNQGGTIDNCFTYGTISGPDRIGGLVGDNDEKSTIKNSGSFATVSGTSCCGGLVGRNGSDIINSFAQGNVTGRESTGIGGLVGGNSGRIKHCYATGIVNGGAGGGLVGNGWNLIEYSSYYNSANTGSKYGFPATEAELKDASTFYMWDFDNIWEIDGGYPTLNVRGETPKTEFRGEGTEEYPYLIENEKQLYALATGEAPSNKGVYYKLVNDIKLVAKIWTPIGAFEDFKANFDGAGHTVSGMNISDTYFARVGFFGAKTEGTVKNLNVVGNVNGESYVGILIGYSGGTVENCSAEGTVNGDKHVGGLIGWQHYGNTVNCSFNGSVFGTNDAIGGLIGNNYFGKIESSTSVATVNGYTSVGGLTGNSTGSVISSSATAEVNGKYNTGGLIGENRTGTVTACFSEGTVTCSENSCGGLLGNNSGTVENSGSFATVKARSDIGGLVGVNRGSLKNCFAHGNVKIANSYYGNFGALVGYNYTADSVIENCYSIGTIEKGSKLTDLNQGTVTSSYYIYETADEVDTANGTPVSSAEMKVASTFEGWDFEDVWAISPDAYEGYPYLRCLAVKDTIPATGASVTPVSLNLIVGEMAIVSASVSPATATNKNITLTSSDESIITVENGIVTARKEGSALVIATTEDGGFIGECTVTVKKMPASGISLNHSKLVLTVGKAKLLTATILPENTTNKNVTWTSSNTSVATVSANGVITAKAVGTARITVKTEDGGKTATCTVTVNATDVAVTGVSLNTTATAVVVGNSYTFTAAIKPANANNQDISWSTSNPAIATVKDGVVTAKSVGVVKISARTADGGFMASCMVTVNNPSVAVNGVSLNKTDTILALESTLKLIATVSPSNATNKTIYWTTSNPDVASISDGLVTAKAVGVVKITAKTADGSFTASCRVEVKDPGIKPSSVVLNKANATVIVGNTLTFTATVLPANAYNTDTSWITSDPAIATVKDGVVTAKSAGVVKISARTVDGGFIASCIVTVNNPNIAVEGVELDKTDTILALESTLKLIATISPSNATNKTVYWATSNPDVASISGGLVTAKAVGVAKITARTADGSFSASCYVEVKDPSIKPTSVTLGRANATVIVGNTITFTATVLPANAYNKDISWITSNPAIATVKDGVVTTISTGVVKISARTVEGGLLGSCLVAVNDPTVAVTGISLNTSSATVTVGNTLKLTPTITPTDATNKTIYWATSNPNVASISGGLVTAKAVGVVKITARTADGSFAAVCWVTVKSDATAVTGITLDKENATISVGDTLSFTATVLPADAANKNIVWITSNPAIASFSSPGVITANSAGVVKITARTADGGFAAVCWVEVQ